MIKHVLPLALPGIVLRQVNAQDCSPPTTKSVCYFTIATNADTWGNHLASAQSLGCSLASILNEAEHSELNHSIDYDAFWLGGRRVRDSNIWEWADGSEWCYSAWAPGEPDAHDGNLEPYLSTLDGSLWNDNSDQSLPAIYKCCLTEVQTDQPPLEPSVAPTVATGASLTTEEANAQDCTPPEPSSTCSLLLVNVEDTWENHYDSAMTIGCFLASILNEQDQHALAALAGSGAFWLGGRRVGDSNLWEWVDGSDWCYSAWAPGEPNAFDGNPEPFLSTWGSPLWDDNADQSLPAIYKCCQTQPQTGSDSSPLEPSTTDVHDCTPPEPSSTCSFTVVNVADTWENHRDSAVSIGCSLASILNEQEQEDFSALTGTGAFWLGGRRVGDSHSWEWVDGSDWCYSAWAPGEPNAFDGNSEPFLSSWGSPLWDDNVDQSLPAVYKCCLTESQTDSTALEPPVSQTLASAPAPTANRIGSNSQTTRSSIVSPTAIAMMAAACIIFLFVYRRLRIQARNALKNEKLVADRISTGPVFTGADCDSNRSSSPKETRSCPAVFHGDPRHMMNDSFPKRGDDHDERDEFHDEPLTCSPEQSGKDEKRQTYCDEPIHSHFAPEYGIML